MTELAEKIGLWIDHEKAFIVTVEAGSETVHEVTSDVGKHVREHGGTRGGAAYSPQHGSAGNQDDRRYYQHLTEFYDRVIERLKNAEKVLIIGPGEAKGELAKRIGESKVLRDRVAAVEPSDKLTQPQLVAKVREYFAT